MTIKEHKTGFLAILTLVFSCTVYIAAAQAVVLPGNGSGSEEKIYVQTDRSSYLAGEIMWFRVYHTKAGSWVPLDLSSVAYVELLDRNSRAVIQSKIALHKRGGSGSFYLPSSLASDRYVLRAYTRWMRNSGPADFFETPVTIMNTVASVNPAVIDDQPPAIHFYPEGGQLLSGTSSVVGLRVTDGRGLPADVSGVITGPAGDTLSSFSTFRFGIGKLNINAEAGVRYQAHFELDGNRYSGDLPVASDRGYALHVQESGASLQVTIRLKGLDRPGENMQLITHTGKKVVAALQVSAVNDRETVVVIDKSELQEGVNYITLFNQQGEPVCERLVFQRPQSALPISADISRQAYGSREKVEMSVQPVSGIAANDTISYSVSVFQSAPWDDPWAAGMASHRWLLPALQGSVVAPEYYFSNDEGVAEATENLLLTHGWRSFTDKEKAKTPAQKLLPEMKGHLIMARVVRKSDGSPVPGELCYLSAPASPFDLESARSDRQGVVYFEIDNYYGPGELVVKAGSDSAAFFRVDVLTPFSEDKLTRQYQPLQLTKDWEKNLQLRSIAMQAQNIYRADSLRRFAAPHQTDTLPFYGKPEFSYDMDEYKRFNTMEEVFREFVSPIYVAIRGGKYYLSVIDPVYKQSYNENVMVLIDGIPLTDHNKIFSYDPYKIKKLDVVTRRFVLGSANVGGVASFETYGGRFDAFELDPSVIMVDYEGLQLQRRFYSPDYNLTNNTRIPDFRSTLFWEPNIVQSSSEQINLSFFTGDQKGRFRVVIEGLTDSGRIVRAEKEIVVE